MVGFGYRSSANFDPGGTPKQRETEIKGLDDDLQHIEAMGRQLSLVTGTREALRNLYMYSEDLRLDMKAPPVTISYDRAWLDQIQESLSKQIAAATLQAEMKVIHSPNISNEDFVKYAKELSKNSGPRGNAELMLRFQNNDFEFETIPVLRACQKEAAAKYGATPSQETADAIAYCTHQKTDWYPWEVYGAAAGIFILGLYGRRLRRKWGKAAAATALVDTPPPAPGMTAPAAPPAPVIETTRDIKVRTLKLISKPSGTA